MRWKLLVGNIVAVLLVGVLAWALTQSRAADALVTDIAVSTHDPILRTRNRRRGARA